MPDTRADKNKLPGPVRKRAFLGLGSNIGDRELYLRSAISELDSYSRIKVLKISSFHDTAPLGSARQGRFLNAVVEIETTLEPEQLLDAALDIEKRLGRIRAERWGPRTIDVDILTYGELVYESPRLSIPHPLMHERAFVLAPLAEIAPAFRHPVFGASVGNMLSVCSKM